MTVDYDANQLDVGKAVVQQIETASDELKSTIESSVTSIKDAAMKYKVNLDGIVDAGNIDTTISQFNEKLGQTSDLADIQAGYLNEYEKSPGIATAEILKNNISKANNVLHPDNATRLAATAGMGVAMFAEGFIGFFEDMGDAVLNIGSGVTSFLGFKDASEQLKSWADFEVAKTVVEENDAFRWVNQNSYFDKDSTYAKVFKAVGKATAAAVTTHCASKVWASHLNNAGKVANVAEDATQVERAEQALVQAKKTVEKVDTVRDVVTNEVKNVSEHAGNGESITDAVINGTVDTAGDQFVKRAVVKPASKAIIENTPVGQAADEYLRSNGEAIEDSVNGAARTAVSTVSRAAGGEVAGEVIDGIGDFTGLTDDPMGEVGFTFAGDLTKKVISGVGRAQDSK